MSPQKRRRMFVDPQLQGALVVRCIMHWAFCIAIAALILLCWQVMANPGRPNHTYFVELWFTYWRAFVVSIGLLLVVMKDLINFSNRIFGPLIRIRHTMRRLAAGEHVESVKIREKDFWHDFAAEFNVLINRIQRDSPSPGSCPQTSSQEESEAGYSDLHVTEHLTTAMEAS